MHERRYSAAIERLRTPERVAKLEIERVLGLTLEGATVATLLDVGTGSGLFAEAFAAAGLAVTGVDTNPDMLLAAREFVPSARMVQATFEELPFDDASFDIVFLGHVLHETDDLLQALEEARRVARLRVCVLEWPFIGEEQGPPLHHRLDPDDVLLAAAASGFAQVERITLGHMEYFRFSVL